MRARYPEEFKFRVPAGFSRAVIEVASREGICASEYLRRIALQDRRGHPVAAQSGERRNRSAQAA
jgi:transposase-like protein